MKDNYQCKLLILGGNRLSCDIVKAAKSMGVYTIVTDWYSPHDSPAKLIADEYWDTSILDFEKLVSQIRQSKVNGIITGFTDSYLLPYQHLCELAKLPCYASKEQFEITLDKGLFKKLCTDNGIKVVPEFSPDSFNPSSITKETPVLIKPVDNSGSRGIFICDNPDDFPKLKATSLSFSQKGTILIEKYMQCDDVSFEYKIQDGEVTLSSICDRYIHKSDGIGSVTSGLIYPSKYLLRYTEQVDPKVRSMFHSLGLKNGVLFMQAFVENGEFYFYEMGYRLSGGRHFIFTDNQNNDSSVKQLISFALTGSMDDRRISEVANPAFKDLCCQLSVLCHSGKISRVLGREIVDNYSEVIDTLYSYNEGDIVGKEGTSAQIFARFHIVANDSMKLASVLNDIKKNLIILDENGQNMVVDFFDLTSK